MIIRNMTFEKRRAKRLKGEFNLQYSLPEHQEIQSGAACTTDISSTGFAFRCSALLPVGAKLAGELNLPFVKNPVRLEASIARVEKPEGEFSYVYGARIIKLADEDRKNIENHINFTDVDTILRILIHKNVPEVQLEEKLPPLFRSETGEPTLDMTPLSRSDIKQMLVRIMSAEQYAAFEKSLETSFVYYMAEGFRFKVSVTAKKGPLVAIFRTISTGITTEQYLDRVWWVYQMDVSMADILLDMCHPNLKISDMKDEDANKLRALVMLLQNDAQRHKLVISELLAEHSTLSRETIEARIRQVIALERNASEIYSELAKLTKDKAFKTKLSEMAQDAGKHDKVYSQILSFLDTLAPHN